MCQHEGLFSMTDQEYSQTEALRQLQDAKTHFESQLAAQRQDFACQTKTMLDHIRAMQVGTVFLLIVMQDRI